MASNQICSGFTGGNLNLSDGGVHDVEGHIFTCANGKLTMIVGIVAGA